MRPGTLVFALTGIAFDRRGLRLGPSDHLRHGSYRVVSKACRVDPIVGRHRAAAAAEGFTGGDLSVKGSDTAPAL